MSKRWIMVYDDGRTPAIHTTEVEAEMMADALAASGLPPDTSGRVRYTTCGRVLNHRQAVWGDGNKHRPDEGTAVTEVEQKELAVPGLGEQFRRGQTSHALPATFF